MDELGQELEFYNYQIDNKKAMERLLENDDFKRLFSDMFVDSWTQTQLSNFANSNQDSRRKINEGILARSIYTSFIQEVIEDGLTAENGIKEIENMEKEDGDNLG